MGMKVLMSEDFTRTSEIVSIPAGSGYLGTEPATILSDVVPSGVRVFFNSLFCRALDIPESQIAFGLRLNGTAPASFLHKMELTVFRGLDKFPITQEYGPGLYSIVVYNLSGTGLPHAGPSTTPLCQVGWSAMMIIPQKETPSLFSGLKSLIHARPNKLKFLSLLVLCLSLFVSQVGLAQSVVVPGMTSAFSATPIICVNPTTFLLESCGGGGGALLVHDLLSATHTDTTPAAVLRGDIVRGSVGPVWSRLALGLSGRYLRSDGTDLSYSAIAAGGVGTCVSQFFRSENDNAAPTCESITDTDVPNTITLDNLTQITTRAIADTTGTLLIPRGGTGLTTLTTNQVLIGTAVDTLTVKTLPSCSNVTTEKLLYNNATQTWSCGTDQTAAGGGYATIQNEGTGLAQQTTVNMIGVDVDCVDNGGASKTDCTINNNNFFVNGVISPAQLTADQNDWAPTNCGTNTIIRTTADQRRTSSGLSCSQTSGMIRTITNVGGSVDSTLILKNESTLSTAANRFAFVRDIVLRPSDSVTMWYDSTLSRWTLLSLFIKEDTQTFHTPFYSTDYLGVAGAGTTEMQYPWELALLASATHSATAGLGNHPGIMRCTSSTTTNSGCYVMASISSHIFAGGEFANFVFQINTLANLTARMGYHDSITSADAVDGGYIEIPSTGNAVCKTANNSTRTTSATIATLAAATWYHAKVYTNSNATSFTCELYSEAGNLLGTQTNTTNIPTGAGREFGHGVTQTRLGTAAASAILDMDYMDKGSYRALLRGQ